MTSFPACRLLGAALCALALGGCAADPVAPVGGLAAGLEVVSGNEQEAPAASVLPLPIRIRVVDALGEPVGGAGVAFLAEAGSGTITPATAVSDAEGFVTASWQLPAHTGTMSAQAVMAGVDPASLTATSLAGPAAALQILGPDEAVGDAGTVIDTAMRVRVVDQFANPVSGATVTFRTSPGGGTLGSTSATSDDDGVVRTAWSVAPAAGWHTLTAEAPGGASATMHGLVFEPAAEVRIDIGYRTGCVITDRLYCWGRNAAGQVGDGSTIDRDRPVPVTSAAEWRSVAVGEGTQASAATCAVTTTDQLYCWGSGSPGMTGTPGTVSGAPPVRSVTLGQASACALGTDARVLCWGDNSQGQLGSGTMMALSTPTAIQSSERFRSVSMGTTSACAITLTGRLYCWGSNSVGQLGDGTETRRLLPTPIAQDKRFARVTVAEVSACALELRGGWYCWGLDDFSRVSGEAVPLGRIREPRLVPHVPSSHGIVLGPSASCTLAPAGNLACWGDNRFGVLGDLGTTQQSTPLPVQSSWRFTELALGDRAACGISTDDVVACWGENASGIVGIADRTVALTPVRVEGTPAFNRITAGGGYSCGLRPFGETWCWGDGSAPQPVPGNHAFQELDAGDGGACGLTGGGEVWCWGNPALLGLDGDPTPVPRQVPGGHFFGSIAVGGTWACATSNSRPWCWGSGRGTPSGDQSLPFAVVNGDQVSLMRAAGPYGGMCGITPVKRVQCWHPGRTSAGVTGSLLEPHFGPDPIGIFPNCVLIADGSTRCYDGNNVPAGTFTWAFDGPCGLGGDGVIRCFGLDHGGSLGTGQVDEFHRDPLPILGNHDFAEVSIGGTHGCGITWAGEAWCWGTDRNLALGNGALYRFATPQVILSPAGGVR